MILMKSTSNACTWDGSESIQELITGLQMISMHYIRKVKLSSYNKKIIDVMYTYFSVGVPCSCKNVILIIMFVKHVRAISLEVILCAI